MNKIITSEEELSKYSTLNDTIHHESDIYIHDDVLYKILLYGNRLTREATVQRLYYYDNPSCVTPTGVIYTSDHQFLGFEMPYLREYVPSTRLIFNKSISYKDKLKIAKKIATSIERLSLDGMLFWDIHPDNNLISKDGNIKIVDMDGVRFKDEYDSATFTKEVASTHRLLSQLSLSYISKMNVIELAKTLDEEDLKEIFSSVFKGSLSSYLDGIFGFSDLVVYPSEFIEDLEEKDLDNLRSSLIKKLSK